MGVEVHGLQEVGDLLTRMQERVTTLQPVLEVYAQDLKTLVDDSFDQSRAPDGTGWEPLKPATVRKRRRGSSKPLVDTGQLRNSITSVALNASLRVGTNVPYAGVHQFGGGRGIPARPFLPISSTGDFVERGPAGEFMSRLKAALIRYITTGRVE